MTYEQALQYIHSLQRFGIKPGLERVRVLCAALGNPQDQLRCVHVAGTNGKGSTCTMLAEIAMAAGKKTGLYTSPYVIEFRERMRINGGMIPQETLCRLTEEVQLAAQGLAEPVTEFEFCTALAFLWFARQSCDLVVLEVGLGGRWDATNIIKEPLCSVIMKIALDHTELLGDTLALIAAEKCGIIKAGCPVVSTCEQAEEALQVIREVCEERGSPLVIADETQCVVLRSSIAGSDCVLAGLAVHVPLAGRHMCQNALTATLAARQLGISEQAIQTGIARVIMPARMEALSQSPLVILDGGHNPDGARALVAALREYCAGVQFCAVCGMMKDKDVGAYLRMIQPFVSCLITAQPDNPRALTAEALAQIARDAGYEKIIAAASLQEALRLAETPLLICGSFYLAGEVKAYCAAGMVLGSG